jgi:DNA-binding NarL/FixJ family response regulator
MAEVTRVLIADDDELFRAALAIFLGELPGVQLVGEAADGRSAVALARAVRADVVVLDLDMPELDGFAAARLIRDRPDPPRIVICTGAARGDLERAAELAGADVLLRKGSVEDFERALRSALGLGAPGGSRPARRARPDQQAQQDREDH